MPIGKWFACFSVEVENQPLSPWKDGPVAGIDVGQESFATRSNGEKTEDPRFFFKSEEKELEWVQGMLSKTLNGSS
jgi:putative transposase